MREETLARASAATVKPRVRPRTVGHHPNNPPRPKSFYVQLEKNDLYMLIISKEFMAYVKGHPYPQLVSIECCKDCQWTVHANPYRDVRLDTSWLGPGSVRASVWLAVFQLGSGWLVVLASQKNELDSGYTETRCGSVWLASLAPLVTARWVHDGEARTATIL
jgi:hypothetical protein